MAPTPCPAGNDAPGSPLQKQTARLIRILASESDPFDPMDKAFHRLDTHFLAQTEHLHSDWTLVHDFGLNANLRTMAHVWQAKQGGDFAVAVNALAAEGLRVLILTLPALSALFRFAPLPVAEFALAAAFGLVSVGLFRLLPARMRGGAVT